METFLDEPSIRPLMHSRNGLVCPILRHRREWTEGMRRRWPAPNAAEQPGYDDILFALWQFTECAPRLTLLQQHGVKIDIGFEQAHRRVTVPEAQCLDLVCPFKMGHAEFKYGAGAVSASDRRYPGAAHVTAVERGSHRERPPF